MAVAAASYEWPVGEVWRSSYGRMRLLAATWTSSTVWAQELGEPISCLFINRQWMGNHFLCSYILVQILNRSSARQQCLSLTSNNEPWWSRFFFFFLPWQPPQRGAQNFDAAARKRKGHEFTNRQAGQLGRKNLITAAVCSTFTMISHPNKKHEQKLSQTKWSTVPMIHSKHNKNSPYKQR